MQDIAQSKFTDVDPNVKNSFSEAVVRVRGHAVFCLMNATIIGMPSFTDVAGQLTRLSELSAPRPEKVLGKSWFFAPFWLRLKIYDLFLANFPGVRWQSDDVETRRNFLLHGIPKCTWRRLLLMSYGRELSMMV